MIVRIKKIKDVYNVSYRGEEPTKADVYNFCIKSIDDINNAKDFQLLCDLYKKVKVKYDNKMAKLEILKVVADNLERYGEHQSNEIWGRKV